MNMWTLPPADYQRVILNPEAQNYHDYNRSQAKGNAGRVTTSLSAMTHQRWRKYRDEEVGEKSVYVKWDNNYENSYLLRDLLPIEESTEQIFYKYVFNTGYDVHGTLEELEPKIDEIIIKNGADVEKIIKYDAEHRKEVYKRVAKGIKIDMDEGREMTPHHVKIIEELSRLGVQI